MDFNSFYTLSPSPMPSLVPSPVLLPMSSPLLSPSPSSESSPLPSSELSPLPSPESSPLPSRLISPKASPESLPTPQLTVLMPLPPLATYSSFDELKTSIQAFARENLYAFVVGRSRKLHRGNKRMVTYVCDRCGRIPSENAILRTAKARKRQTTTRKTGCEFSVNAVQLSSGDWELRYRPEAKHSIHNHLPSYSVAAHSSYRKFTAQEIEMIRNWHRAGLHKLEKN